MQQDWITGCFHTRSSGDIIEFKIRTDPPEAVYWSTYKLKLSDVKIVTKMHQQEATIIRREIVNEINEREHPKKNADKVPKVRKKSNTINVKTGQQ